jgi:hypothetical protein
MTIEQRDKIKQGVKDWFSVANFFLLLTIVWYSAQWQKDIENRIDAVEKNLQDESMHPSFYSLSKMFVPRTELEIKLDVIIETMKEMKSDIKNLEKK